MKKRYRWPLVVVAVLVVGLIALRAALPGLVRDYLNDQLADLGAYRGHVEEVDIALWRGAYAVNGVDIVKVDGDVPVPFFRTDSLDLSVSWSALWKGAIVAEATFIQPELNFVDAKSQSSSQSGEGTDWRTALQKLLPIELNVLRIVHGRVHFRNFNSQPPVDLEVSEIEATVTNLSNADRRRGARISDIDAKGLVLNQAPAAFHASLDPLGDFRDFELRLRVDDLDLTRLNELTKAYGNFDFQSGSGKLVVELEANEGRLEGFAKPLLDNVDILDLEQDADEGVLSTAWEALVGGVGWLFRNHPEDRLASQIEIRGDLNQQDVSAWQAFVSVLHNAFVDAYQANFKRE